MKMNGINKDDKIRETEKDQNENLLKSPQLIKFKLQSLHLMDDKTKNPFLSQSSKVQNRALFSSISTNNSNLENTLLLTKSIQNIQLNPLSQKNLLSSSHYALQNRLKHSLIENKTSHKRLFLDPSENKIIKKLKSCNETKNSLLDEKVNLVLLKSLSTDLNRENKNLPLNKRSFLSKKMCFKKEMIEDLTQEEKPIIVIQETIENFKSVSLEENLPTYSFTIEVEQSFESVNFSNFIESEKIYKLKKEREQAKINLKLKFIHSVSSSLISSGNMKCSNDPVRMTIVDSANIVTSSDPEFVLKVALYAREELNIRITANLLLAFAAYKKECRPFLRKYFSRVIRLPSDWIETAVLYQSFAERHLPLGTFPAVLRKAMIDKFPEFDSYQLAKYNRAKKKKVGMRSIKTNEPNKKTYADCLKELTDEDDYDYENQSFTLKTLIRRLHINSPAEHVMCLIGKKYPQDLMSFYRSGLLGVWEEEKSGKRMKLPIPETWETQISLHGNKAEIWEQLIDNKKLPFMAMLRSITKLIMQGISGKHHDKIINILTNERSVAQSRQFPFRFFSAFEAVNSLKIKQESVSLESPQKEKWWEKRKRKKKCDSSVLERYLTALNESIRLATVHNVATIKGRTIILCDVHEQDSCWSTNKFGKPVTLVEMGILLCLMCQHICEHNQLVLFGSEKYEIIKHSKEPILSKLKDLMLTVQHSGFNNPDNKSNMKFPIEFLLRKLRDFEKVDNIILLSSSKQFPRLKEFLQFYRMFVNPELLFAKIDLHEQKCSVLNESADLFEHPKNLFLAGFSEQLLRFIADRGNNNQLQYIENIDMKYDLQYQQQYSNQNIKMTVEDFHSAQPSPKWHSVRIFISSTFRDMHAERDLLVRYVFPELRRAARSLSVEIHEIDLRWGITEQEMLDNKAVEICLREARKSDIFLGILGDRHGNIPDPSQIPEDDEFSWVKMCPDGASITELEFYGGALANPDRRKDQILFCIRDNSFLNDVPEKYLPEFIAESENSKNRVSALKDSIFKSGFKVFNSYPCCWGGIVRNNPVVGELDALGEWILKNLWIILLQMFSCTTIEVTEENDFSSETVKQDRFVSEQMETYTFRKNLTETCQRKIEDKDSNLIIISGKPGSGKTALMAYLTRHLQKITSYVFLHFVDASSNRSSVKQMVQRFCMEIANKMEIKFDVHSDYHDLIIQFSNLLENLQNLSKNIFFIIDGLNEMTSDQTVSWLPQNIPKNVTFILSVNNDSDLHKYLLNREGIGINVGTLAFSERVQMINSILKPHRKFLSTSLLSNQINLLASKREAGLPLYLTLACNEIRINAAFDQLNAALVNLPSTVSELIENKLDSLCEYYGNHETCLTIGLLATVKNGLTEEDLYLLLCLDYDIRISENETHDNKLTTSVTHKIPRIVFAKLFSAINEFLLYQTQSINNNLSFTYNVVIKESWNYCKMKWIDNEEKYIHFLLKNFYKEKADPLKNRTWMGNYKGAFASLVHHNLILGDISEAVALLTDIKFLYAKANHGLIEEIIQDFENVEHHLAIYNEKNNYEQLFQYKSFITRNEHLLSVSPSLMLQQAINDDDASFPTKDAMGLLKSSNSIVHWLNKLEKHVFLKKKVFNHAITCIEASANGRLLTLGTETGIIIILDFKTYKEKFVLRGHSKSITCLCMVGAQKLCSASDDATLNLWDLESGNRLFELKGHLTAVSGCCCSSDGKLLVSVSLDCTLRTWNVYSGQEIAVIKTEKQPINCVALHPNLPNAAIGLWKNSVRVMDLISMKRKQILPGYITSSTSIAYSPCGNYIACGSLDGKIFIWSSAHGYQLLKFSAHPATVNKVMFSSCETLISTSDDYSVKKWGSLFNKFDEIDYNIKGRKVTAMAAWEKDLFLAIGFNHSEIKKIDISTGVEKFSVCPIMSHATVMASSENSLCVGFVNGVVSVINKENGSLQSNWKHDENAITFVVWVSKKLILSGSADGILTAYHFNKNLPNNVKAHMTEITCIAAHPWKQYIATVGKDKVIKIWTVYELKLIACRDSFHKDWITCCSWFYKNGIDILITGSNDSYIKLWNIINNFTCIQERITIESFLPSIDTLMSLKTSHILIGCENGTFSVFTTDGKFIMTTTTPKLKSICQCITTSNSEKNEGDWHEDLIAKENEELPQNTQIWSSVYWVAITSNEKLLNITLFPDAEEERLNGHSKSVLGLCKIDENYIATCSKDCSICVFDVNVKRQQLVPHKTEITAVSWCKESLQLITGSRDGFIVLWKWLKNLSFPKMSFSHQAHTKSVNCICFTSTDLTFATASNDCLIKFWNIEKNALKKVDTLNIKVPVICMDYNANEDLLVAGGWFGKVWLCSVNNPEILFTLKVNQSNWIFQVKFCSFEKNSVYIIDSGGFTYIGKLQQEKKHEYEINFEPLNSQDQAFGSIRSVSEIKNVALKNIKWFVNSTLGFVSQLMVDNSYCVSSTNYQPYNSVVLASEYNEQQHVLLSSSEDSLLKIWLMKEDTIRQVGQFECAAPVTKIKVINVPSFSSQPLIVCGDSHGNIYFLHWL